MSTKVYTGFRMTAKHFPEVLSSLGRASAQLADLAERQQNQFLALRAASFVDAVALGKASAGAGAGQSPLEAAQAELEARQAAIRRTNRRDPAVDFEAKFVLWHCRRQDSYLGLLQSELPGALNRVLGLGVARAYGYWNNTDKPDDVSVLQWSKRRLAWDECLDGRSGPSFTVEVPEPAWLTAAEVFKALPSYEQRVRVAVDEMALTAYFEAHPLDGGSAYTALSAFRQAKALEGTLAWQSVQDAQRVVTEALAPELTLSMLTTAIGQPCLQGAGA
ncbi:MULTISPECIES: hypothetical protein [unclassified Variovorax]|uniref:hypothetical protein n=1 Tax=unclassified Variovorax TaxID=663243 RepID=UPI001317AFC8|nr:MULTISPECIES: hypothetical protein [unclassified Variovorax]VTU42622.1 hypothetical protein H6P1_00237 [Variovorax sp. PBL-H6]VTU43799.1 hypothetical protein SRS16P1_00666 [Variovorax sp. SRS16]VTU43864.1 hypothetical protein E5P1_00659 [Variovorax sp. PBL-E5]